MKPDKINKLIKYFEKKYPNTKSGLDFTNPFELLVATILSAQTTDQQVNRTTKKLFKKYSTPKDYAELEPQDLEKEIKGCGLYRNKSKNIVNTSRILLDKYQGNVPDDFDSLIQLPGVGRKTANVVLSNAFNQDAIAVDTHVFRVSNRLGIAKSKTTLGTEMDLQQSIPKNYWIRFHRWLIRHGREFCISRNPKCTKCELKNLCDYYADLHTYRTDKSQ